MKTNQLGKDRRVLVTGSTGFIGSELVSHMCSEGSYHIRVALRHSSNIGSSNQVEVAYIPEISGTTDWSLALRECDLVIHLAARVHVMQDTADDPLFEFRRVNVEGTLNLARQAAFSGVRRFIFISSIKVNGEETSLGRAYTADDLPTPEDPYAVSKFEAEQGLFALSVATGMEVVVIRPAMVYGIGVKGNFKLISDYLKKGYPFPLGFGNNKRSFVSVYNLVDLIITCMEHPSAANQIFLVSDGEDLSTMELIRKISAAINKHALIIPFPSFIIKSLAKAIGMHAMVRRIYGSLQVDISKTCDTLDWKPVLTTDEGLRKTFQNPVNPSLTN